MIDQFYHELKEALGNDLPGTEAQYAMAPSNRNSIQTKGVHNFASVIILLYPINGSLHFILEKRPEYLGAHSGQISLPGGKKELTDSSEIHTAIREANEEIGVKKENIEILGALTKLHIPVSNITVTPFVGRLLNTQSFVYDKKEVEYLLNIPVSMLVEPSNCKTEERLIRSQTTLIPYYDLQGHHVWGATAMILSEFLFILKLHSLINFL
jgi:8-oxo-dGTP pyrophosphatase MutT (NUDIX family)